jgi:lipopolysaccharide/colanic/teichoic acid biosynthesis glycosyltransferase
MPTTFHAITKRTLDVCLALIGLALVIPLLGVIVLVVKLDSPGPAFFGQDRVGRGERPFKLWKVRTMVAGAAEQGLNVTAAGDPRITRTGRFLRSSKLDELPQLWNVLKGDMSLVGPRPEVQEYVDLFRDDYALILTVRPGITDEASLAYRREEEMLAAVQDQRAEYVNRILPDKIRFYRAYVEHPSLTRDFTILLKTLYGIVTA